MIEEILEALKPHDDIVKEYPITLSVEEQKVLLDYITNLKLNQTKKVFDTIGGLIKNSETCSYRYLIYDLLGFQEKDYVELMSGLSITNMLVAYEDYKQRIDKALYITSKLNPDEIPCWFDEIETTLRGEKYE